MRNVPRLLLFSLIILSIMMLPAYAALTDGLVSLWPMNEVGGNKSVNLVTGGPNLSWYNAPQLTLNGAVLQKNNIANTTLSANTSVTTTICLFANQTVATTGTSLWGVYLGSPAAQRSLNFATGNKMLSVRTDSGTNYTYAEMATPLVMHYFCVAENNSVGVNPNMYIDGVQVSDGARVGFSDINRLSMFVGGYYNSVSGPSGQWNGTIKNLAIWNRTLTASEVAAMYAQSGLLNSNLTLTAKDGYTTTNLNNFFVRVSNGSTSILFNTTTSQITTSIGNDGYYNLTFTSNENGGYFNTTILNFPYNISSNPSTIGNLYQNHLSYNVTYEITHTVPNTNLTFSIINATTNATSTSQPVQQSAYVTNLSSGIYNISIGSYPDTTIFFLNMTNNLILTPLQDFTLNVSVYDMQINVTYMDNITSTLISSFGYNVSNSANGYASKGLSSGTTATLLLKRGLQYIINASKPNYISAQENQVFSNNYNTLNLTAIPSNSIYLTFYDITTGSLINQRVTVTELGQSTSAYYTNSTVNGRIVQYPLQADTYLLSITSVNYSNISSTFTINEGSTSNLSYYLSPLSSGPQNAQITVRDSVGSNMQGATVTVFSIVNGTTVQVLQGTTDVVGLYQFPVIVGTSYTVIINKLGYQTISFATTFTTLTYTVNLQLQSLNSYGDYDLSGVNYYYSPTNNTLPLNNSYPFTWVVTPNAGINLSQMSLTIYNANGAVLYTNSIIGAGGTLSTTLNTSLYNGSYIYAYYSFTKLGANQVSLVDAYWITDGGRAGSISGLASYVQANMNIQQRIILWLFACMLIPFALLLVFMRPQLASLFVGGFCVWAGLAIFSFNPLVMGLFGTVFALVAINGGQI